jgi:hypothetical protein
MSAKTRSASQTECRGISCDATGPPDRMLAAA